MNIKTTFLFLAIILTFASCKKDYTCKCVTTLNGVVQSTSTNTISNVTLSEAQNQCNGSGGGGGLYSSCSIQ